MADFVYQVTVEDRDVLNETDPKNRIQDSDLNHLKTAEADSFTVTVANGADTTQEVVHGLSKRPLILAYFRDTSTNKWFVASFLPELTGTRQSTSFNVSVYCDATKVYFKVSNQSGSSKNIEVQYEICYEGDS